MITGGSPTMHPDHLRELCKVLKTYNHHVTLETEASSYVEGCFVDLVSISPKMSNSTPKVGFLGANGKEISQKTQDKHEKLRKNYRAMMRWILDSRDYQIKPVVSSLKDVYEIEQLMETLDIPKNKVYLMPAGANRDQLDQKRQMLVEFCINQGFNYSDRLHIITYNDKRGV